jgi:uncharacterized protein (TIGR03032 family)
MNSPQSTSSSVPAFEISASRQFTAWLAEQKVSLTFTTYQAGKIFFIGLRPDGQLSVFERTLERPMGLCSHKTSLYVSTLYQLWRFENICYEGATYQDSDALYVPRMSYVTGDLDVHDIAVTATGQRVFVNTLFGCLATISETYSFEPLWHPPFLSKLAAEDRCHLNGLAMREGQPAYVTAVSQSDVVEGWREHRQTGGCVVDVQANEVVVSGLSMPHSPRWYRDKLWLLNSGTGEFGWVDLAAGKFEPVAFCPGYLRGLVFHGDFAVVGLSRPRNNKTFTGLALDDRLAEKATSARCGLMIVDLRSGDVVHSLTLQGIVEELYDVAVLTGVRQPSAIGFKSDEIRRVLHLAN